VARFSGSGSPAAGSEAGRQQSRERVEIIPLFVEYQPVKIAIHTGLQIFGKCARRRPDAKGPRHHPTGSSGIFPAICSMTVDGNRRGAYAEQLRIIAARFHFAFPEFPAIYFLHGSFLLEILFFSFFRILGLHAWL
jgi:hypothetical protein